MSIKLKGSSFGSVSFDAPADTSPSGSDITLTLPTSAGSANQFLKNGSTAGTLEYSSMVEDSSGNVGIGTTSPTTLIHGQVSSGSAIATLESTATSGEAVVAIKGKNSSGTVRTGIFKYDSADRFRIGTTAGIPIAFETNDNEHMRLDSSGRLLVNKTGSPSAGEGSEAPVFIQGNTTNASGPAVLGLARGQSASAMGSGASLGIITFTDEAGNDFAEIKGATDGGAGTDDHPGRLTFLTTPNNSSSPTERLRISNLGVSDFKSSSHVVSTATSDGASTSTYLYRGHHSNSTICFNVWSNGNVENTNNSYGQISDSKLKENIVDASSQWDNIKDLRVRNFNFIEGQTHTQIGVIAQEVETVSPGLVSETPDFDEDGNDLGTVTKSVKYSVLYMKAVKALQEAQTRIETLETQNTAQQAQIDDLLARVTALEAA